MPTDHSSPTRPPDDLDVADTAYDILGELAGRPGLRARAAGFSVVFPQFTDLKGDALRSNKDDPTSAIPAFCGPADIADLPRLRTCLLAGFRGRGDKETYLVGAKQVRPRDVRGRLARIPRYIAELTIDVGSAHPQKHLMGWSSWKGREDWQPLEVRPGPDDSKRYGMAIAVGNHWVSQFHWHVNIGTGGPDTPLLSLRTDPEGAREIFRLREVPDGKSRRVAIRNWVSEHYRQRRGGSAPSLVEQHLRGRIQFDWFGLRCEIVPPFDEIRSTEERYAKDPRTANRKKRRNKKRKRR